MTRTWKILMLGLALLAILATAALAAPLVLGPSSGGTGITTGPIPKVLYQSTAASDAHTGVTAAATTVMPNSAEGSAATDIGAAYLGVGAGLDWQVDVAATGDADGDETLTVNILFGAKTVGTSGAIAIDGATEFTLRGSVDVWTNHASTGTGAFDCFMLPGAASTAWVQDQGLITSWNNAGTNAFIVQLDWGGTTDAADTAAVNRARLTYNNYN